MLIFILLTKTFGLPQMATFIQTLEHCATKTISPRKKEGIFSLSDLTPNPFTHNMWDEYKNMGNFRQKHSMYYTDAGLGTRGNLTSTDFSAAAVLPKIPIHTTLAVLKP